MKLNNSLIVADSTSNYLPGSLLTYIRTEWKWWLFGALFSFMLASVLTSGLSAGLLPNIEYPYVDSNDGQFNAIQRAIEGWVYDNPRSGYPFGSNSLDYPGSDTGSNLILKLIGSVTGNWPSAHNLYYLLGYAVTFVSAFCVLRAFGLTVPFAFTAATLFDFLPFHYQRLIHLYYTWYFVVPIFFYIALKIFHTNSTNEIAASSTGKKLFYAVCLMILGSFGVYFAAFGLIVISVVAISSVLGKYNSSSLKLAILASSFVVCGVFLNLAPTLIYQYANGSNNEVAKRSYSESEIYGFKFAQLVIPESGHRISRLSKIAEKYNHDTPLINENTTSTLGLVGALGLLAVFGVIVANSTRQRLNSTLSMTSVIVLILIMFGTIGGFGSLFAQTIMASIRGWNRISPFIGFGALLVLFLLLQGALQKRFTGQPFALTSLFVSVLLLLIGLFDQTVPHCTGCQEQSKSSFIKDRDFIRSIENSLPVGSAVYQLPYMSYPEASYIHRLGPYDLSTGFLHSTSLRWSFGGMRGRSGDLFYRSLANESLEKQIEIVKKLGFAGVYIDKRGYKDSGLAVIDSLTHILGAPPALVRADGEIVFFRINEMMPRESIGRISAQQIMTQVGYGRLGVISDSNAEYQLISPHADLVKNLESFPASLPLVEIHFGLKEPKILDSIRVRSHSPIESEWISSPSGSWGVAVVDKVGGVEKVLNDGPRKELMNIPIGRQLTLLIPTSGDMSTCPQLEIELLFGEGERIKTVADCKANGK